MGPGSGKARERNRHRMESVALIARDQSFAASRGAGLCPSPSLADGAVTSRPGAPRGAQVRLASAAKGLGRCSQTASSPLGLCSPLHAAVTATMSLRRLDSERSNRVDGSRPLFGRGSSTPPPSPLMLIHPVSCLSSSRGFTAPTPRQLQLLSSRDRGLHENQHPGIRLGRRSSQDNG